MSIDTETVEGIVGFDEIEREMGTETITKGAVDATEKVVRKKTGRYRNGKTLCAHPAILRSLVR
jgi:hypothetical protein